MSTLLDLLDLLNTPNRDGDAVGTSIRVPRNLRAATQIAVDLGLAESLTSLAVGNLRNRLEGIAQMAVLENIYIENPQLRSTPAQLALAAADMDGNPLAHRPDLIELAARKLAVISPDPEPDDILLYASGLLEGLAAAEVA